MDSWTSEKFEDWNTLSPEYVFDKFGPPPQSLATDFNASKYDACENKQGKRQGHKRRTQGTYDELDYDSSPRVSYDVELQEAPNDQKIEIQLEDKNRNLITKRKVILIICGICLVGAVITAVIVASIRGNPFYL